MATLFAFCDRRIDCTLALYAVLPSTGRFAAKSSRSLTRSRARSHAQNFSTGFRSGDLAGIFTSCTWKRSWAPRLSGARRKDSLSHRMFQGPPRLVGFTARKAAVRHPVLTAAAHSAEVTLRSLCHRATAKPPGPTPPQSGKQREAGACRL